MRFNPEASEFKALTEYVRERLKRGGYSGGVSYARFGRFTGLPKHLSTLSELGITQYLDSLHLRYRTHVPVRDVISEWPSKGRAEFDVFVPSLALAIELNPAWHKGGRSEIPRVAELDALKARASKSAGIKLVSIDPTETSRGFAHNINFRLVPFLRENGIRAPLLDEGGNRAQEETARKLMRRMRA